MASSSIVIKVKLGDTLRRFDACIHNGEFNFNMNMLRKKIRSLFDLTTDVDFTLTYIDEDGDVVTISDNYDLYDIASQYLYPLRITVKLNAFKNSFNHDNGLGNGFHRDVRCDGCEVSSKTGPSFKSKLKDDHDLCSVCLMGIAREADYIGTDSRNHTPLKGFNNDYPVPAPPLRIVLHSWFKLDSHFVLDVSILNGAIMATSAMFEPSVTFTKIWRLRNTGNFAWPRGSQLVYIGGNRFTNTCSVQVEIPDGGLLVDEEVTIAVDFTSPEEGGRYVSYWRMVAPCGEGFGECVWVEIKVTLWYYTVM